MLPWEASTPESLGRLNHNIPQKSATSPGPHNVSLLVKETIMHHSRDSLALTRRSALTLAAGAFVTGWRPLDAFSSDFWNKKEPAEWSAQEIEQLTTKSPWSKEVSAHFARDEGEQSGPMGGPPNSGGGYPGGGYPGGGGGMGGPRIGGMGGPRIGGMGGPGMGGGGMGGGGRGRRGGGPSQAFQGTVRWESARPILEAMKAPLPDTFANHYVIGVSGFPMMSGRPRSQDDDNQNGSAQATENQLDHLKALTFLKPKDKEGLEPGLVLQQPSAGGGTYLFGFSKEMLALSAADKEVTFSTRVGRLDVKAKFNLKEMMYRGDLAL
jgi:hypothetical protein